MATRQSVDECLLHCNEALEIAYEQFSEASKQEHYNDDNYIRSQHLLQLAANELQQMAHSCNDQQREQLNRTKMQVEQMQHDMITLRH